MELIFALVIWFWIYHWQTNKIIYDPKKNIYRKRGPVRRKKIPFILRNN